MHVWVPYEDFVSDVEPLAPDLKVAVYTGRDGVPADVGEVDFFVAPYATTPEALGVTERMPRLRVLQLLSAGYEHALLYLPSGVELCNAQGVHDASTAELAVALMLASLRRFPKFVRAQDKHAWEPGQFQALADKHVLILGYGSIGAAIDRRLRPFETIVTRMARTARPEDDVHSVDELPTLLPQADIVVVVTPLTPQTTGMVNAAFIRQMKQGALLVNVARGAVVDTAALLAALEERRICAALDVTNPEPLPSDHPLWDAPGLLISPHVGGNTSAFLPRARRLVREQLTRFVNNQPLENVVVPGTR